MQRKGDKGEEKIHKIFLY